MGSADLTAERGDNVAVDTNAIVRAARLFVLLIMFRAKKGKGCASVRFARGLFVLSVTTYSSMRLAFQYMHGFF